MKNQNDDSDCSRSRKESVDVEALNASLSAEFKVGNDYNDDVFKLRKGSLDMLDTLSSSLDNIVKGGSNFRKDSDASALLAMASGRKESDADVSALYSLTSVRKGSDLSVLSTLVRDEEEMMLKEEQIEEIGDMSDDPNEDCQSNLNTAVCKIESTHSDPFENLRKLSDASDTVLRKLSDSSDVLSLNNLRKDSDGTLEAFKDGSHYHHHHVDLKSPGSASVSTSAGFGLSDMKLKMDNIKDDTSIGVSSLFGDHHHDLKVVEPNPVFVTSTLKGGTSLNGDIDVSAQLEHHLKSAPNSDDGSVITINAANHRMLMDALLEPTRKRNRAESWGGMSDISLPHHNAAIASTADIPRGPSPHDFGGLMSPSSNNSLNSNIQNFSCNGSIAKQRNSLDIPGKISVSDVPNSTGNSSICSKSRERCDSFSVSQIQMPKASRERTASFVNESSSNKRIRLDSWCTRDRLDSVATRDRLDSLANLSGIFSRGRDRLDSLASLGEVSLSMSLGDLEDVAGKLELIVHGEGEDSSIADSVSVSESAATSTKDPGNKTSLPAPTIQVDSEAVQSAVQAAMAATSGGVLDLLNINSTPGKAKGVARNSSMSNRNFSTPIISNSKLKSVSHTIKPSIHSTPLDEAKMEEIRARARAAAGYVHPGSSGGQKSQFMRSKKRPLLTPIQPPNKKIPSVAGQYPTLTSNSNYVSASKVPSGVHVYSDFNSVTPKRKNYGPIIKSTPSSSGKGGQSNQKWEEMFECLVLYVKEQKSKETGSMSEEDRTKWEWSGNVPTMYKTKDGKALGRWINNQRSAKSKGSLKMEREERLVSTGLKWSVLTTNAWTDMMEELKIYVTEKTKDGKKWDGNVPTNYKIKQNQRGEGADIDEDKNLGRWINRQRSLYQAGKLKEERRKQLEEIGLKWAVLSTTSWHTMYESLCQYSKFKRDHDKNGFWDGNVPASYETNDKPAKKLGRWVNRQRSAFANKKLKKDFVEKLEKVGLKWTAMDSKKDLETSEILLRQRVVPQTQRPMVIGSRSVLQTVRPTLVTSRPTIVTSRPTIVTSRPGVNSSNVVVRGGPRPVGAVSVQRLGSATSQVKPGVAYKPMIIRSGLQPKTTGGVRPIVVSSRPGTNTNTAIVRGGPRPVGASTAQGLGSSATQVKAGTMQSRPIMVRSNLQTKMTGVRPIVVTSRSSTNTNNVIVRGGPRPVSASTPGSSTAQIKSGSTLQARSVSAIQKSGTVVAQIKPGLPRQVRPVVGMPGTYIQQNMVVSHKVRTGPLKHGTIQVVGTKPAATRQNIVPIRVASGKVIHSTKGVVPSSSGDLKMQPGKRLTTQSKVLPVRYIHSSNSKQLLSKGLLSKGASRPINVTKQAPSAATKPVIRSKVMVQVPQKATSTQRFKVPPQATSSTTQIRTKIVKVPVSTATNRANVLSSSNVSSQITAARLTQKLPHQTSMRKNVTLVSSTLVSSTPINRSPMTESKVPSAKKLPIPSKVVATVIQKKSASLSATASTITTSSMPPGMAPK